MTGRREILGRLAMIAGGVATGIAILAAAEIVLRVAGVGAGRPRLDPFAGYSLAAPNFVPAERADGTRVYRLAVNPDVPQREFLAVKPPGTFRIFVVGESSAAGVPYGTRYAFPAWLADRLAAALPGVRVEVVNAAVSGYVTRRMLATVEEIAHYAPDLLVVYAGHNELFERRFYAHLMRLDPRLFRLLERVADTRLFQTVARVPRLIAPAPPIRLDDAKDSLQLFGAYGRHPQARERAYTALLYRENLTRMVRVMRDAGARTALVTLSQNFADWPPGASAHRRLAPGARAAWKRAVKDGERLARTDCERAAGAYRHALEIDDGTADVVFRLATCERRLGRYADARAHFRLASDLDQVPMGAPTGYNDVVRDVAAAEDAILVDADAALERDAPDGMVGDPLFVDMVHPTILGHERIAAALADGLATAGLPAPAARWQRDRWKDPDPAALYAADPGLSVSEHLVRAVSWSLAGRLARAHAEAEEALRIDPSNTVAAGIATGTATAAREPALP